MPVHVQGEIGKGKVVNVTAHTLCDLGQYSNPNIYLELHLCHKAHWLNNSLIRKLCAGSDFF